MVYTVQSNQFRSFRSVTLFPIFFSFLHGTGTNGPVRNKAVSISRIDTLFQPRRCPSVVPPLSPRCSSVVHLRNNQLSATSVDSAFTSPWQTYYEYLSLYKPALFFPRLPFPTFLRALLQRVTPRMNTGASFNIYYVCHFGLRPLTTFCDSERENFLQDPACIINGIYSYLKKQGWSRAGWGGSFHYDSNSSI